MNTKSTRWLIILVLLLGGYIVIFEMPRDVKQPAISTLVMPELKASLVTRVELMASNVLMRAEQKNDVWTLTSPLLYPGQKMSIERLIDECRRLSYKHLIPEKEVKAQPRGLADYGLEPPQITIKIQQGDQAYELHIGNQTPVGKLLYLQRAGSKDVIVTDVEFLAALPRTSNDWRDRALINLAGQPYNRLEMRPRPPGFELVVSNQLWRMTWPIETRADSPGLNALMDQLQSWPVLQFVTDDPKVDLEPLGLQPPEAELAIGLGTNDLAVVQFGRSPTNYPGIVFARRLNHTNIVLVARSLMDQLRSEHTQFRDRRLISYDPTVVDTIDIHAAEHFTLRRQTNGTWRATSPQDFLADTALVRNFLANIGELNIVDFDSFVVTDFAKYGLAPPARQYSLKLTTTNSTGGATNQVLAQIDLGGAKGPTPPDNLKVYARRSDESAMYTLWNSDVNRLPQAAYELRDRRLWYFTTNNVVSVTSVFKGKSTKLLRSPAGVWSLGTPGIINPDAVEESLHLLSEARAVAWTDRGAENFARWGINNPEHHLTIELLIDGKPETVKLYLSAKPVAGGGFNRYAASELNGQTVIFEFPQKLYDQFVVEHLTFP